MKYESQINQFAALANEYCLWIESDPMEKEGDIFRARILLAELYAKASTLPDIDGAGLTDLERPEPAETDIALKRFRDFPIQYYWVATEPFSEAPEVPGVGDITDDLVDVYRDLNEGLWYFRKSLIYDAAYHWKFSFDSHWGEHAINALRALHLFEHESNS